ncbi:MAG: phosphoadenosine phosphosulfate reductase [Thiohalomonadales bacterium]
MNIVCYGGGINSTAMIVEMVNRGISIDLILFADTGGEKPHTYKFIKTFNKWLKSNGCLEVTRVQTQDINGSYISLEYRCLITDSLPSKAYGFSSCSDKYKIRPQNKYINNWSPAKEEWKAGRKINKYIGFDAGESHRNKKYSDDKYNFVAPLIAWDYDREYCIRIIADEGLPSPGKSSCFYCPHNKKHEILEIQREYPELMRRALKMESNANLTTIKGLGRRFSWREFLDGQVPDDMPDVEICGTCYDG